MSMLPERRDRSWREPENPWLDWSVRELNYQVDTLRLGIFDEHGEYSPVVVPPVQPVHDGGSGLPRLDD